MPVITYTAVNRGELVGGHTAGLSYQIEHAFEKYPRLSMFSGSRDETLDGTPESWLDSLQKQWSIVTDLILPADIGNWREFVSSVMNAETFQIDFTGTIAVPVADVDVYIVDTQVPEAQLAGFGYRYSFTVKGV